MFGCNKVSKIEIKALTAGTHGRNFGKGYRRRITLPGWGAFHRMSLWDASVPHMCRIIRCCRSRKRMDCTSLTPWEGPHPGWGDLLSLNKVEWMKGKQSRVSIFPLALHLNSPFPVKHHSANGQAQVRGSLGWGSFFPLHFVLRSYQFVLCFITSRR